MIIYKYGKIMHVNTNYLILDHNGEGDLIYAPNISRFKKDELRKIFISQIENEYTKVTYGFDNFKELVIFEDLIEIQGLGPKTAISILNIGWENVINYVATANKGALGKIPYVSSKIANAIIFSYQDKYAKFMKKLTSDEAAKIKVPASSENENKFLDTMKMLGFKQQQIKFALDKIELNDDIETCVENAIKLISQQQHETSRV
ncbi:Holliday junction DNA helicase [Metamycoplasma arthritidis]|uniref:Holliday junction branch migration complex subunit RuvA n=1 Tax=Metamycoplasma arthritidis (strain 158L3-1) TaxID=243272 RepID=RUVA_META1|nr:Holliday junction branch migration protein RuvA [Metamycoplasma arthritidis]B3PMK3.1 RecName: Full=Holliday junction branch migration complex subunit RuvA [Metamycoplasma arthritidis 158L3-1]ACF07255.1 Holliday junction DNA helicase motor protein [Metamycoplasma arthritidis 158L3-1]VEU78778.1 Holliday junction DNA helicase [Metamycoplasma arthritidis]